MESSLLEQDLVIDIDYELVGYVESLLDGTHTIHNGGSNTSAPQLAPITVPIRKQRKHGDPVVKRLALTPA